jgi:hypothetical protein
MKPAGTRPQSNKGTATRNDCLADVDQAFSQRNATSVSAGVLVYEAWLLYISLIEKGTAKSNSMVIVSAMNLLQARL